MKEETINVFNTLNSINVNEHTETKDTGSAKLTYLSWPWAWAEVMKRYPDAEYNIYKDSEHRPYIKDDTLGYMVSTSITINGQTREMWLPVMDNTNKSMKREAYTYNVWNRSQNKWVEKRVEAATMFDINKTIMRCLVKNLAMFGLGLYIYAGEDLPDSVEDVPAAKPAAPKPAAAAPKPAFKPAAGSLAEQKMEEAIAKVQAMSSTDDIHAFYAAAPAAWRQKDTQFYKVCEAKLYELKSK